MKTKTLVILVCVAAALIAVAVKTSNNRQTARPASARSQKLFQDLPVNDISRVLITTAGRHLELLRGENGWIAREKFNYPVKFDKIKKALMTLADLEAGEQRELNKKQLANVKLISPLNADAATAAKGTLTQVFTTDEKPAASLLIGSDRLRESARGQSMPDGTFISVDDGKTALLTPAYLGDFTGTDPVAWLDTEISSIDATSITNVTITLDGEKPLVLYTEDGRTMKMDDISSKYKLDDTKARSTRYSISSLRFDDVADPALDNKAMGFEKASTFRAVTDKNEIYTVTIGTKAPNSDNRYLRFSAEFFGTIPEPTEQKEGEETLDPARQQLEEAKKRVEASNNRHGNWTYLVSSARLDSMLSKRDDLVVKKED